jgi:hypothetical protein
VTIKPLDFQLPTLQLPFEQLYDQMQKMQQEKDLFDVMKTMKPQYVEGDKAIVEAGLKEVQGMVSNVAQAFASGKTTDAMRELRDAKTVLTNMWSPTGVFGGVQDYYKETQKALAEIDEFTKDNTDPAYRYVYKDMLRQSIKEGSGIDPVTGKRRTVSTPDMTKEVNVLKEADDYLTNWKSDTRTGIERRGNDYFWIGTTEQVSATELSKAMDNFMSDPRIANALNIQAKYRTGIAGEEGITTLRTNFEKEFTERYKEQQELASQIGSLLKGTKEDIQLAQTKLNLKPTGVLDEATNKAFVEFQEQNSDAKINEGLDVIRKADATGLYRKRLEMDLKDALVPKHSFIKENGKLMADVAGLQRAKLNAMRSMIAEFKAPVQLPYVGPLSVSELDIPSPIQTRDAAQNLYKNTAKSTVENLPEDLQKAFKSINKKYAVTAEYFNEAVSKGLRAAGSDSIDAIKDDPAKVRAFKQAFEGVLRTSNYGLKEGVGVGGKAGGMSYGAIADVFINGGDRYRVRTFQTEHSLRDPYEEYTASESLVQYMADDVLENKEMFDNFYNTVTSSKPVTRFSGSVPVTVMERDLMFTKDELREKFKNKDPMVMRAFENYTNDLKTKDPERYKKITGSAIIYGVEQPHLRDMDKDLLASLQKAGTIIPYVDISRLDEETKNFLLTKKNKDRGDYEILGATLGNQNANGTNQPFLVVNVQRGSKDNLEKRTIAIPAPTLNRDWVRRHKLLQAATSFNFETGQPTNEEAFYSAMDQLYDLDNAPRSAFNAAMLSRTLKVKDKKVGTYELGSVPYGNNLLDIKFTVDSVNNKQLLAVFPPQEPGGKESAINIPIEGNTLDDAITAIRNIKANLHFGTAMQEVMGVATTLKRYTGDKQAFIESWLNMEAEEPMMLDSGDDEE